MNFFTHDRSFYRSLVALAIPVALQNLITFAVSFADNVMVSSLGDSAVSGVYMANQIQTFLQMFSGGIEATIMIMAAQYWGKRDTDSIKSIVSIGIRISAAVGLILNLLCLVMPSVILSALTKDASVISDGSTYLRIVCFSYVFFCITQSLIAAMRSVEIAKVGMYVSACSLFINVGLNYVLIFGKLGFSPMGLKGAAIATLISRIAEFILVYIYTLLFATLTAEMTSFGKRPSIAEFAIRFILHTIFPLTTGSAYFIKLRVTTLSVYKRSFSLIPRRLSNRRV